MHVWVTGCGGLIGHYLVQIASEMVPGWKVTALNRNNLDLTDFDAVRKLHSVNPPDIIIHAAAMSKTVACQQNPDLARLCNVEVTKVLAGLVANKKLLFFSTDLVFDGTQGNYNEDSPVSPISVYAETKVESEKVVLANPRHTVVRTSINFGISPTRDRSFNEEMRLAWMQGKVLDLFVDEFRCPIPAAVTAQTVWQLAKAEATGIYHVAGTERLSRFQIGQLLAPLYPEANPQFVQGTIQNYKGARRAPDSSMNCQKVQQFLGIQLPRFSEWIQANPQG